MPQLLEFITRHPLLAGAAAATCAAALIYEVIFRLRSGGGLSPREAVRLINQGATVMDLRDAASYGSRHIVDAVNATAAEISEDKQGRLKKKRPVLIVCENGMQSGKLVATLRGKGNDNAFSLSGGLTAWARENLPLVSAKGRS